MALTPGTRLGPYEIISALGAGGMGEVYRAKDTNLDRDVAIKVLPESFALDADRVARFSREAKTLAALNHPNIAAIYGLESNALVMELVDGEDLSVLIDRGHREAKSGAPLKLNTDDAVAIARQIAEALEAAHEAGIVHRDLKPANIKVRTDGTVKVLDFGLAKALEPAGASGATTAQGSSAAATMTSPAMTQMGIILGTAAYMSPEQAKGRPVDRRADIWAFGVVLHEMLTGRRLFDAEDVSETLAAVLTRDLGTQSMPPSVPVSLRTLVADCLVRDPKKRLRDIGDARLRLDKYRDEPPTSATPSSASIRIGRWLWPAVAAIGVAAVAMAWMYLSRPLPQAVDLLAFEIAPEASTLVSLSPDGRQVAYAVTDADTRTTQLWLRRLDSIESRVIPGTVGAVPRSTLVPFDLLWSQNSQSLVFATADALRKVDMATGQGLDLAKIPQGTIVVPGGWSGEGVILFGKRGPGELKDAGIWRIADTGTGGPPVQVTEMVAGDVWQRPSGFLPDGRHFLYYVIRTGASPGDRAEIRIGSIDLAPAQQDKKPLLTADGPAVYAPAVDPFGVPQATGYLLFVRRGDLVAQAFDPARGVFSSSTPVQVAPGANTIVHASLNGRLLYRADGGEGLSQSALVRFDRRGKDIGQIGPPGNYGDVNRFPDGLRLAVVRTDRGEDVNHLYVVDVARGAFTRLSPGTQADYASKPGPDGVAYTFSPEGLSRDIYVRAGNGVGDPRLLIRSDTVKHANDWSPDGKFLIFDDHVPGREQDLLLVRAEGGTPIPFLTTSADETAAQFSPDGKWIVYRTTDAGRNEVFVRDFAPDRVPAYGTEKAQISVAGGDKPRWKADGSEIFYLQGTTLMAVPFTAGRPPRVGTPVALFETRPTGYFPYVVMPDGTFVVNTVMEARKAASLRVLLNWQAAIPK